jgi:hypothetical protein
VPLALRMVILFGLSLGERPLVRVLFVAHLRLLELLSDQCRTRIPAFVANRARSFPTAILEP